MHSDTNTVFKRMGDWLFGCGHYWYQFIMYVWFACWSLPLTFHCTQCNKPNWLRNLWQNHWRSFDSLNMWPWLKVKVTQTGIKMLEFAKLYHNTMFEKNWSVNVQMQTNINGVFCFAFLNYTTWVGFSPLTIDHVRHNGFELHQTHKSQQYTKLHPNWLRTLA